MRLTNVGIAITCTWIATCAGFQATAALPRSTPEEQGVSSAAVTEFVEAADQTLDSLHSVMLVRHGHVIAEGWWTPYHAETNHSLYSLSKSFTSTAVGLAIAEGKLSLDDPVLKFFPDDVPENPSNFLKSMRVSDLLRMNTGQQTEPPRPLDQSWTKAFLAHPVPFKPGTHFLYNTSATYMAAAIVEKATGEPLLDYLKPRLFDPLNIAHPTWERSPQGIATGGYGLSVRTEDIASFGQLYLQKGRWQGRQLVPEAWVEAATARQTSNGSSPNSDWDQGYGYQFWRCRHGAYRGDGAFGQFCVVLPEQDAALAITSGLKDMQAVLNLVWDKLLPAFQSQALPVAPDSVASLRNRLSQLTLRTPQGDGTAPQIFGKTFTFPANGGNLQSLKLTPSDESQTLSVLSVTVSGTEYRVPLGKETWQAGRSAWSRLAEQPTFGSAAWVSNDQLMAKLCFPETPFVATIRLKFAGHEVQCSTQWNVGFGPTAEPPVMGVAE